MYVYIYIYMYIYVYIYIYIYIYIYLSPRGGVVSPASGLRAQQRSPALGI